MSLKGKNTFIDDVSLWNSFIAGDRDAYACIYEKYSRALFLQGLQFTSDKELVRDCIHDIFVKIYDNRTRMKPVYNLRVYLFIALRNSISTTLKKQKMWFDEFEEDSVNISDNNSIEDDFINKELENNRQRLMSDILASLTMRQKEVVHYRFIQAMNMEEICTIMDMNYQSVQNLIQRSIKKIKESLKKIENDEYKM